MYDKYFDVSCFWVLIQYPCATYLVTQHATYILFLAYLREATEGSVRRWQIFSFLYVRYK